MDDSVKSTYDPPNNNGIIYIASGVMAELGIFAMLWLVLDSARTAAAVLVFLHVAVAFGGLGAWLNHRATRSTIEHLAANMGALQAPAPQPDIDAQWRITTPQLPAPSQDWMAVSNNTMIRSDQVERSAIKIYTHLWPHTPPTRENIQARFPDLQSNGFVTACMEYLKERGVADGGGQGRAYTWVAR